MKKTRIIFWSFVGIIVLAGGVFAGRILIKKHKKVYITPLSRVEIIKPFMRDIKQSIRLTGYIEADATVPVVPLVQGIITDYFIKAGDRVKKDDILAVIDKATFTQGVLQARAAYGGYENTFKRIEDLYNKGAATLQDYQTLKAQRDASRAQLELAELQLAYTDVRAPISGTVLVAPLATGGMASNTQPLAVLANLQEQVVRLDVPEQYFDLFTTEKNSLYALVSRYDELEENKNTIAHATIETVSPYIDAQTKTFKTVFKISENVAYFRPGMFAEVQIIFNEKKSVPVLPLKVFKIDGSAYIFRENESTELQNSTIQGQDDELLQGRVVHHVFVPDIKDNRYFTVPQELSDEYFVIAGQGIVFDGQEVTAKKVDGEVTQ